MADGSATFVIDLDASGATRSAEETADALEGLNKELAKQQQLFRALKGGSEEARAQAAKHKEQVALLKSQVEKETLALAKQGTTLKEVKARQRETADAKRNAAAAESAAIAKAKEATEAHKKSQDKLLKSKKQAIEANKQAIAMALAEVGAITAAAAAAVAFAAGIGGLIISFADSRRSELLHLEGLTKIRNWYGIASGSAQELQQSIDRVSGSSALSRQQVGAYAEQLYKMGLRGNNLAETLDAMSIKASTQGDAQAQMFAQWAAGTALAGGSVKGLADRVRSQLGGIAQKQLLSLDVQWMKFKENVQSIGKVFNIEPILRGLNVVLSMFREGQAVGDAWRVVLEALFGPIFGKGEEGGKAIKRVIQGATIAILHMATAGLNAAAVIGDMMPDWVKKKWEEGTDALKAAEYAMYGLGVATAIAAMPMALLVGRIIIVGTAIKKAYDAFQRFRQIAFETGEAIGKMEWGQIGASIVNGIVNGIRNAATGAVDSVKGLAVDIKNGFKNALGIHSPSRVFAQFGAYTVQGFGQGVERESSSARGPLERMAAPPPVSSYTATTNTSSSRAVTIHTLNVNGVSQGIGAAVRDEIARALEGVALEMGGARV